MTTQLGDMAAKYPFQKKSPDPAAPRDVAVAANPPKTSAELAERICEWSKLDADLTEQILQLERAHIRAPADPLPARGDALKLFAGVLPAPVEPGVPEERLASLHHQRNVVKATLVLAKAEGAKLLLAEGAARFEQKKPELDAAMRKAALALIQLERALQERDGVIAKIAFPGSLQEFVGWVLAGRLEGQGFTQCSRFLNYAVTRGWLSQRELDEELARVGRFGRR